MAAVPDVAESRWWGRHLHELRWQAELARLLVDPVYRGQGVPRGDGGPVLLIPGFLAGDASLQVMREWLGRIGHRPHESGIRVNVDCSNRCLLGLARRLDKTAARAGRPVAIVGHSRGGHFAKALAHRRPELVSRVVSMGAGLDTPLPISAPTPGAVAARAVRDLGAARGRGRGRAPRAHPDDRPPPPPRLLHAGLRLRVRIPLPR